MNNSPQNQEISIFTKMTMLANEFQAINLAQGFPNFPIDPKLITYIQRSLAENTHQYAPYQGLLSLREAISSLLFRHSHVQVPSDQILITAGATQAIFTIIQAHVNRNEEVILLDPCYDCYETPILLVGGVPVHIPLQADFTPDWDLIFEKTTHKTKMIIINTPHNPSGAVWDLHSYEKLIELTQRFPNVRILSDEVYEYLTYEKPHISLRSFPTLKEKALVVSSFGKSLQATGWKIGYISAPLVLLEPVLKVHQYVVFSVNSFLQEAIANYLSQYNPKETQALYNSKRDLFVKELSKSRFSLLPCEGTYFQAVKYDKISDKNDFEFASELTINHKVASVPFSSFYKNKLNENVIRLCFAKKQETLERAIENLSKV
jgi:methionine aminotransferase